MPLDRSILDSVSQELQASASDLPPAQAPVTTPNQGPLETGTSYVVKKGLGGLGEAVGRTLNYGKAASYGEPLPFAAMRFFLPNNIVDMISPTADLPVDIKNEKTGKVSRIKLKDVTSDYASEGKDIGATIGATATGSDDPQPMIGAAPGIISKNLGGVANFAGQAIGQPMGNVGSVGSAAKYVMSAMGAGEGSELGGDIMRGITKHVFHADDRVVNNEGVVGELIGGGLGGMLNVARGNGTAMAAKGALGTANDAMKSAYAKWRADSSRTFLSYLMDDYSHLREDARTAVQNRVIGTVANDIRMDPDAQESLASFADAAEKTGVDPNKFNIAAKAATPSLVASVAQRRPTTPEEASLLAQANKAGQEEIKSAARRIVDKSVVPDATDLAGQLDEFQKRSQLRIAALNDEGDAIRGTVPGMSAAEEAAQGAKIKDLAAEQLAQGKVERDSLYNGTKDLADQLGHDYDPSKVSGKIASLLKQTFTTLEPGTVPESVTRLKALLSQKRALPEVDKALTDMGLAAQGDSQTVPIRLRDVMDAMSVLNQDIRNAQRAAATNSMEAVKVKNLTEVRKSLEGMVNEQSAPEVINAYNKANDFYRNNYVPRFKTGENLNLDRQAGVARANQDLVPDEAVMASYLKKPVGTGRVGETSMQNFDNLFGGVLPGTQRVPQAYSELWNTLESRYNKTVLGGSDKFKMADHDAFMHEYEAAINRVPALRDKLDQTATQLENLQSEAKGVEKYYEDIAHGPIAEAVGPKNVEAVFSEALTDPRKMGQLISALNKGLNPQAGTQALVKEIMQRLTPWKETASGIEYDPAKLKDILDRGGAGSAVPGGLSTAFRAAFGKAEGDAHLDRLRALALLAERQASTAPRFLRPMEPFPSDIAKDATGQTGASWLSQFKALFTGRIGPTYVAGMGLGSLFNAKMKEAFNQAQQEALFNPEMSKAILELAATKGSDPVSRGAMRKIFGMSQDATNLIKGLFDYGHIGEHAFNGARVAATINADDLRQNSKNDASKRVRFRNEPPGPLDLGTITTR